MSFMWPAASRMHYVLLTPKPSVSCQGSTLSEGKPGASSLDSKPDCFFLMGTVRSEAKHGI